MNKFTLSKALEGYELAAAARHLSKHTISDYANTFRKFQAHLKKDPPIADIQPADVQSFLAAQTVANKTLLNYHTGLSALWAWTTAEGMTPVNILRSIARPRPEKRDIQPITEADIRALLHACGRSRPYIRPGIRTCTHRIPEADRHRAIILLMLDTGLRAAELCNLNINDVNLRGEKYISVRQGKGRKDRQIPISARTAQIIWKYLASRPDARLDDPLFATRTGAHLERNNLGHTLTVLAERAGLDDIHPHRFRHTFAINYLRNGGDVYTLKSILGHETLEMCQRYLRIAQTDVNGAHRRASPVDNWQL